MFVNWSGQNEHYLKRICHRCFLPSFGSFGQAVPEEKIKKQLANQKQELPVAAMFVNRSGQNVQYLERTAHRCFLPSFGLFGQTVSEEKNLKNQSIRNKSRLWRSCLLTDRDEMSHLYRGSSIDASYQVSVHLAEGFQRRRLKCEKLTDDWWRTTDAKWWLKLTLPLERWANKKNLRYWSLKWSANKVTSSIVILLQSKTNYRTGVHKPYTIYNA
jgi:hypothetical protein